MVCFIPISCTSNELRRSHADLWHPCRRWKLLRRCRRPAAAAGIREPGKAAQPRQAPQGLGQEEEHSTGFLTEGNQGPLEKAKQTGPNTNRSRETRSSCPRVFDICCDPFWRSSAHNPPFNPCHFQHRLPAGGLGSPPATAQGAGALETGALPLQAEGRDAPIGRLFASDPSAPRRGIYKATFYPPLSR